MVDGLSRVLGVREVRSWVGPLGSASLGELVASLTPADVAVLCFSAGDAGTPPPLASAIEAVRAAGLAVAWSGLTRNAIRDIERETPIVVVADDLGAEVRSLLATGTANLLFDREAPEGAVLERPVRICVASYEVVGPTKNGGIGTAATSTAELLGAAGHDVTLLYTGSQALDDAGRSRWARYYEQRSVRFCELRDGASLEVDTPHFNQARAYEVYRWLAARDHDAPWDVVHFPDCQGHGYYALLARRLGLAFHSGTFVVGAHSPTRWVYEANRWTMDTAHPLIDDFLERRSVELADVLVSPSAYLLGWMELRGWELPERRFVQQYPTSSAVTGRSADVDGGELDRSLPLPEGPGTQAARELGYGHLAPDGVLRAPLTPSQRPVALGPLGDEAASGVQELVFFGRLETRKGVELFCDALDLVAEDPEPPEFRVSFIGSETHIEGTPARDYLRERGRSWPWRVRVDSGLNQPQAVAYIREPGRLVVMPSPVDNSPNTVLEAMGLGIPFITSRGGGIPELIHPLDLELATFAPTDARLRRVDPGDARGFVAGLSAEPLAAAVRRAATGRDVARPRFAADPEATQRVQIQWHERAAARSASRSPLPADNAVRASVSVCLAGGHEPMLLGRARLSYERQDRPEIELVVALPEGRENAEAGRLRDAGWQVVEGPEGELDRAAAEAAAGDWLFLCDAASAALPALLSTLTAAARVSDAEVVTCAATYPRTADGAPLLWRGTVPLGGSAAAGLHYDCFGVGGALIRRDAFERLGGFELDGPPDVRRRDLLSRAALAGMRFEVVPEALLEYDQEAAASRALSPEESRLRAMRPYRRALPEAIADLPGLALFMPSPAVSDAGDQDDYVRELEERVHAIASSRSWRATALLRNGMALLRGRR